MWAADHGIAVTNNSYFADPWLYNCVNDPTQRTIWKAERRAIQYAQSKGTVVVSSEGNDSTDLSHPAIDPISPDNTTPMTPGTSTGITEQALVTSRVTGVVLSGLIGSIAGCDRSVLSLPSDDTTTVPLSLIHI